MVNLRSVIFLTTTLYFSVGLNSILAKFTPPPPSSISYYNEYGLIEKGGEYLTDHFIEFNTSGHLEVYKTITDLPGKRVGLRIKGGGRVGLLGWESNTFTGDVFVLDHSALSFQKIAGLIAVQGDIYVKNGSNLRLDRGGQISKTSTVSLENSSFDFFNLDYLRTPIHQSLHRLVVEGSSLVGFNSDDYDQRIYLDDLLIKENSLLEIENWRDGKQFLLVRKDSEHLADALGKIKFGHIEGGGVAGVREYNNDYLEIYGVIPEPATYGAIFGALGLGLVFWRKRQNRK